MTKGRIRRPVPEPVRAAENHPVPHTSKKPILAVTGTKPDRICGICLGKLEPGTALTFCNCGKFFHMSCISELGECPLCGFAIRKNKENIIQGPIPGDSVHENQADGDVIETVYQCPVCDSYVSESSEQCACGAIFDMEDEEIYLCPQCDCEVNPDSEKCDNCGMIYD
ncbi:MAG: hypothetical protein KKH41_06675 [Candidatus Thermoplasmatota archaeon]|nr:hypothetical protein [Candidatus Thermoplasmatota archaeon]MBU4071237.1 hypothetical protein [Candidatus Thermoplasmatota archaeon]MBU4144149.1 hypothetical protein [Candidatus Thermoplasmatota archaeon]MBU4592252.1 hypothetical protein [Candidatus Thermoplasmatota archaeon]